MNKGICFYFGYEIEPETRAKMIKEAGFSHVITCADKTFDYQNGSIAKQVKLFKKYDLKLSSLHMSYKTKKLHYFWEDDKEGEKLTNNLIKDVKIAHKYGFTCVVVHLFGNFSEIGKNRLLRVLKVCEKLHVPLAIENINCQKLFLDVFKNISHPYLKFCYDSGHNHVFDPKLNYLKDFGDKLITLHLHDNDGTADQHTVSDFGNINWKSLATELADKNLNLDYEVLMKFNKNKSTAEECLHKVKRMADTLEALLLKSK